MEEPISTSVSSSSSQQKFFKHNTDVQLIQIKTEIPQADVEQETLIKEIEIGESSAVHERTIQNLEEIVPGIILKEEQTPTAEGETTSKWSHNDTITFLDVLNDVLDSQEEAGGFLSRKNLFSRVTAILNERGRKVPRAEIEKKYNNMLMTYRRCQQRLLKKGQAPFWPYFKVMTEIRVKQEERERSLWDFCAKHLSCTGDNDPLRPSWATKANPFQSLLVSYPFVSTVTDTPVPKCLTQDWQRMRATQEERKIVIVKRLLVDWGGQRESHREERRRLKEAIMRENRELNSLHQELNKGRLHIGKELRFLSQDMAYLSSAVKSVRSS